MKKSIIFKSVFFLACCLCAFLLAGTAAFNMRIQKADAKPQENIKKEGADFSPLGVLILSEEHSGALVAFLDFNASVTQLVLLNDKNDLSSCLYPINRKLYLTKQNLKEIIDSLGGITLKTKDGAFRYTGTQILDMLYSEKHKSEIVLQIFYALSLSFDEEFFIDLANHTDTDLSYIDFYNCRHALNDTLANCVITAEE